jgi:hypothetical protein
MQLAAQPEKSKNVSANVFEVHIVKLRVDEKLLIGGDPRPHIDPVRWRPLIMSFCRTALLL